MNDVVSPFLRGGLGNYIFKIDAGYMASKKDGKNLKVDYSDISVIHKPIEKSINRVKGQMKEKSLAETIAQKLKSK